MDSVLCDELVEEIIQRLPPSAASAASLVCKRWLRLHRSSKSSISLRIPLHNSVIPSLSSSLSLYPHLSSLTLISDNTPPLSSSPDHLLLSLTSTCPNLRRLRFIAGPVSPSALLSLSLSCTFLTSLTISSSNPLSFRWLASFSSLKDLSFAISAEKSDSDNTTSQEEEEEELEVVELPLESLCLSGIGADDRHMRWLWMSCTKLRRLRLRSCEGTGFNSFATCLKGLQELELRTCRSIVDGVLLQLAEHCVSLNSLLLYDGGSRDALHRFISQSRSAVQRLDLRLPLDLDNDHLSAVAQSFRGLTSLRLQSCCLITGEGLKTLGSAVGFGLEELALINCDVVEREPGLLTSLGQKLRGLKRLNLSYNEMLCDKELVSMLVSCNDLVEIKLRGCKGITDVTVLSMMKICRFLETLDIVQCSGIGAGVVEVLVLNSMRLKQVYVEERKVSDAAKASASMKFIEVVS